MLGIWRKTCYSLFVGFGEGDRIMVPAAGGGWLSRIKPEKSPIIFLSVINLIDFFARWK
jgi:hypothetical protein